MSLTRTIQVVALLFLLPALSEAAEVRGRIIQVDAEKNAFMLGGIRKERGRNTWLYLDRETAITWENEVANKNDLAPGRRVLVSFEERDGRKVVRSVDIRGPRPLSREKRDPGTVVGILQRVAQTEREVVVIWSDDKGQEKETACWVAARVKVSRDGKPIEYGQLKEGERVTVRYEQRDQGREAVVIQVGAGALVEEPAWAPRLRKVLSTIDRGIQRLGRK